MRLDGFALATRAHRETLFALSNGTLGVRGGIEEGASRTQGSYMAAVYEQHPIHYHERFRGYALQTDTRVPVPEATRISIELDDEIVDPETGAWLQFEQDLDLRGGLLSRHALLKTAKGRTFAIHAERVLPLPSAGVMAIRYRLTSVDYSGSVTLASMIESGQLAAAQGDDPRIGVSGGEGLLTVASAANDTQASLVQRTRHSGRGVACVQRNRAIEGLGYAGAEHDGVRAVQRYRAHLQSGGSVVLEKYVGYASGAADGDLLAQAEAEVVAASTRGFAGLASMQADALAVFWRGAEIAIDGDPAAEQALRFNLFHLLQSAGRDGVDGTAAKGLTGEGYEGHCFWDTEAFVLPVMVFTAPQVALAMLRYRYRTLDAARAHAREMNHPTGALYAWRTIAGGECSAHYPTGSAAYHINAAVAHAIGLYLDATDDLDFIAEAGAEMLFETARIWLQAGHFNARRGGAFCIHEVTGPDEYSALVNNNFYTNSMAREHLRRAARIWRRLRMERPAQAAVLAAKIGLHEGEVMQWARAAEAMYLPYDEALGIHAQDDGFLDKPHWPFKEDKHGHRPLLLDYHPLTLFRYQICKQADVLMAYLLAGDGIDVAVKRRGFDYYEAITTHDSTLSAAVFGIVANEVGHAQAASRYFDANLRIDLDDLHHNTHHGMHMAALAGSWLGLAQGFGGMRVVDGQLQFSPSARPAWDGYVFGLQWRGRRLSVAVRNDRVVYTLLDGTPLGIRHEGRELLLTAGKPCEVPLQPHAEATLFPRPCEALVFDLDGVLTDTANTHYLAWKRLADEIGVEFDRKVNERLKGVSRMASLDIILERAGREFGDNEKLVLAERKNGYYVAALEAFGPEALFDGVAPLLDAARAAGLKLGLASASRNAALLLEKLGIADRFDYIADSARIANAKPAPDIFLDVAHALKVAPARCIGIEDAAAGIAAIKAAGMPAVGIGDARELNGADAVLPSIAAFRLEDFVAAA